MFIPALLVLAGLGILLIGGEIFVRGSASLARKLRVSALVIGLTIVAFGTSAPELIINIFSAMQGASDIAIGNVLGSNISNTLLVLGVAALIYPLKVKSGTVWKEIPFGILITLVLVILANDVLLAGATSSALSRADGLILFAFFAIFMYYTYGLTKVEGETDQEVETYSWLHSGIFIIGGMLCLFFGGKIMVDNAVILARLAGWSELFIGLTITAIGTSMPELITSAIAAYRKEVDLAIGNVIGSNIFNILWVLGTSAVIRPMHIDASVNTDLIVTVLVSIILFLALFVGGKKGRNTIRRWEGVAFILFYLGYIGFVLFRG